MNFDVIEILLNNEFIQHAESQKLLGIIIDKNGVGTNRFIAFA